jgi:predicted lipoprotein with Yx(FWY)xxD motif
MTPTTRSSKFLRRKHLARPSARGFLPRRKHLARPSARGFLFLAAFLVAAVLIGACGDDDADESGGTAGATETVSVDSVDGVGDVLVDADGAALYRSDQEETGEVMCVDGCASIWLPLTAPSGAAEPTAAAEVPGRLGTVRRPDGSRQVTYDGAPVYTFADDGGPGEVTGDGFSDSFRGREFTWRVLSTGDADASQGPSAPSGGYP